MQNTSGNRITPIIQKFDKWSSLNDSIMGGCSKAKCKLIPEGLELSGELIEEGGGFVSCRSPIFKPPLDLSKFSGLNIKVDGYGRTLKIALFCKMKILDFNEMFEGRLHWVAQMPTSSSFTTNLNIPFNEFKPTIRSNPLPNLLRFDKSKVTQFQLLHSKFGNPGEINSGFSPGKIRIVLRSIYGFH